MSSKHGFSLVLFLVYLFFFSFISCCMCHMLTTCILPSLKSTRIYYAYLLLHNSSDLFVRDIRTKSITSWKVIQPDYLIWNNGQQDIGWHYHDNKIERIEGVYENKWKKRRTSIVVSHLNNGLFTLNYHNGRVIGVGLTLFSALDEKKPVACYVAVRDHAH